MVVGVCALIKPIGVKTSILAKEFPFSILATVALLLMGLDVFFLAVEIRIYCPVMKDGY